MLSSPLVIGEVGMGRLKEVIRYAEDNLVDAKRMKRIAKGKEAPVGDDENRVCHLDFGYRVVYSIEEHPQKKGGTMWMRHMSMRINKKGRVPNEYALAMVGEILGFSAYGS